MRSMTLIGLYAICEEGQPSLIVFCIYSFCSQYELGAQRCVGNWLTLHVNHQPLLVLFDSEVPARDVLIIPSVLSALRLAFNFKMHEVLRVGGGAPRARFHLLLGLAGVVLQSVGNLLRIIYQLFARWDAWPFAAWCLRVGDVVRSV